MTDMSEYGALEAQAPDALLALIGLFKADSRADKIDLGVGVYRDDDGQTPVFRAIKAAEEEMVRSQPTKAYLGPEGNHGFTHALAPLALGRGIAASSALSGVQTPGGTGALRLGAALLKLAYPQATVWMGAPTWPNHAPLFSAAGLHVQMHPFYDVETGAVQFDTMMDALGAVNPHDIVLLHGCCHNPTGADFTADQWQALASFMNAKDLIAFIDIAYQGLGDGLEEDRRGLDVICKNVTRTLIAYSCDKNFGLYRERLGALWVQASSAASATVVTQNLLSLARCLWSMPPDHAAEAVRIILTNEALKQDWMSELDAMRSRINGLRAQLAASHPRLAPVGAQRGMFATLPLSPDAVKTLRDKHAIYMAGSGRINIAGLSRENLPRFSAAVAQFL